MYTDVAFFTGQQQQQQHLQQNLLLQHLLQQLFLLQHLPHLQQLLLLLQHLPLIQQLHLLLQHLPFLQHHHHLLILLAPCNWARRKKKASNFGNGFSDIQGYHRIASLNFYSKISTIRQQIASPNFSTTTTMRPNCKSQSDQKLRVPIFPQQQEIRPQIASPDVSTTTTMHPQVASPNVYRQQSE
jgi:hypothetical protein